MPQTRPIVYLTLDDLIALRDRAAAAAHDEFPILNRHGLMSAIAAPRQGMFGEEFFPHLLDKAAVLVTLLIKNHPFWDGNKRVALLALHEFLRRNGCRLALDEQRAMRFLTDVARRQLDAATTRHWIKRYVRPA